jgi:hypothetical protein
MEKIIVITKGQQSDMEHALGLDYKKKPYRNRYCTSENDKEWNDLVSKGLALKGYRHDELYGKGNRMFWLTKAGVEFILGKKISQKAYDEL